MKNRLQIFALFVLFGLVLSFTMFGSLRRVHARDIPAITETPTAQPTEEVTSEPTVIVPEQPGGTLVIGWNAFSQFVGVIIAAMAAGFVLSLGSVIIIVRSIRQNDVIKDFARYIYLSQPAEVRQKEKELVQLGKEVVGFGEDITSADDPPASPGAVLSPVTPVPPDNG